MEIDDTIRVTQRENLHLIPIRLDIPKHPLWLAWQTKKIVHVDMLPWITEYFNLAVVAKEIWILDFDNLHESLRDVSIVRSYNTLACFSPRGFHLYYRNGYPQYLRPQSIRHGNMYALIPPSKIQGKSYWWLDHGRNPILDMSKVR